MITIMDGYNSGIRQLRFLIRGLACLAKGASLLILTWPGGNTLGSSLTMNLCVAQNWWSPDFESLQLQVFTGSPQLAASTLKLRLSRRRKRRRFTR